MHPAHMRISITIALLFLLHCFVVTAAESSLKCFHCGKPVAGTYVNYDGHQFHESCFKKIAPRCAHCDEMLTASYVELDGRLYHKKCYQKHIAPRCGVCGKVLSREFIKSEDGAYHKDCYKESVALRCDICDKPFEGAYKIDFWGVKFHAEHQSEYLTCDYCKRIICQNTTGGGVTYDDGRNICNLCHSQRIDDPRVVRTIVDQTLVILLRYGIEVDMSDVPVRLTDMDGLVRLSGNIPNPKEKGICLYEINTLGKRVVNRKNEIYILSGMPLLSFESVLAHEMMHVWMNLNCAKRLDPGLCEGTANFASYIVLSQYSNKMSQFLIDNMRNDPDTIYGDGFRIVERQVDRHGLSSFLKYLGTIE